MQPDSKLLSLRALALNPTTRASSLPRYLDYPSRCLPPPVCHSEQGFTATFKKTEFGPGEWQEQLAAPEPAFSMLGVADLVPPEQRSAYAAAGGELV